MRRGPILFVAAVTAWITFCLVFSRAHSAELAIGDSIAVGLQLPGSAKVGIGPKEVVRRIGMTPLPELHDQVVVLSTGLSNNPAQSSYVLLQMKMLKAAGAKVVLLGVGATLPQSVKINQWLSDLADYYDVPFIDGWVDVHPADYRVLLENIRLVECQDYELCGV